MSVSFFGDYSLADTVEIPFNTFSSDDPAASVTVTDLVVGDVYVHKDGAAVAGTPGGKTLRLNVGGANGSHLLILDLSNTDDAGLYALGSKYQVRIEGVTVDAGTLNSWIGAFGIDKLTSELNDFNPASDAVASVTLVDGVTLTDRVTLVDGVTLTDRTTLVDGVTLTDRVTLVDGVTLTDRTTLVDGVTLTDRVTLVDTTTDLTNSGVGGDGVGGAGATTCNVYTQTAGGVAIPGVDVWVTTDSAGLTTVAGKLVSNVAGLTTFYLDPGTYYVWRQLSGYTFTNPQTTVVA